jgi:hypothetical protein
MRLNLGCGNHHHGGWVNVDRVSACNPDQVWDLEQFPWPWPNSSAEEVHLSHVLEHLGAETSVYLGIIKELYRVCHDGAHITIVVPHPRHDNFLIDPTHVRPITPEGLRMFSQRLNLEWIKANNANTPLGLYNDVDFDTVSAQAQLAEPWRSQAENKTISEGALRRAASMHNNVIEQFTIVLRAVKPSTSERERLTQKAAAP